MQEQNRPQRQAMKLRIRDRYLGWHKNMTIIRVYVTVQLVLGKENRWVGEMQGR